MSFSSQISKMASFNLLNLIIKLGQSFVKIMVLTNHTKKGFPKFGKPFKGRIILINQYLAGSRDLISRIDLSIVLILADFSSDIGAVSI